LLSKEDLLEGLESLGFVLSENTMEELFKVFDVDGDGRIRHWEFVRILGQASLEGSEGGMTTATTTSPLRPNHLPNDSVFLPVATKKAVLSPDRSVKDNASDDEVRGSCGGL